MWHLFAVQQRLTIHDFLTEARSKLARLTAVETWRAMQAGTAVVVDTRSAEQRRRQGVVPGTRHHPLSLLEWRLCPSSKSRDADLSLDDQIVLLCAEGYSSSLAAVRLQALGFHRATDVIGGVEAWHAAGLPLRAE